MCLVKVAKIVSYKSLTSWILETFCLRNQLSQPYSDIRVVFAESELLADLAADDIVTFLLYEFSDLFAFETKGEEATIADFPIGQSFLFKCGNKFRMIFLEYDFGGYQKRFSVGNQVLDLLLGNLVSLVVR